MLMPGERAAVCDLLPALLRTPDEPVCLRGRRVPIHPHSAVQAELHRLAQIAQHDDTLAAVDGQAQRAVAGRGCSPGHRPDSRHWDQGEAGSRERPSRRAHVHSRQEHRRALRGRRQRRTLPPERHGEARCNRRLPRVAKARPVLEARRFPSAEAVDTCRARPHDQPDLEAPDQPALRTGGALPAAASASGEGATSDRRRFGHANRADNLPHAATALERAASRTSACPTRSAATIAKATPAAAGTAPAAMTESPATRLGARRRAALQGTLAARKPPPARLPSSATAAGTAVDERCRSPYATRAQDARRTSRARLP